MDTIVRQLLLRQELADQLSLATASSAGKQPNPAEIKQLASDIAKTGEGLIFNDYDARMQALAKGSKGFDAASRQALVSEVINQDDDADSWLSAEHLNNLVREGRISDDERHAVKEGIASAYAAGHLSHTQMQRLMNVNTQLAPALRAERFQAARDFFSGDSPTLSDARQRFLEESFKLTEERAICGIGRGFDSALALTFMADAGQQADIARAFERLKPTAQRAVAAEIASASIGYNNSRRDIADLPNPLDTLTRALQDAYPANTSKGQLLLTQLAEGMSLPAAGYSTQELRQQAIGLYTKVAQGREQQLAESPDAYAASLERLAQAQANAERVLRTLPHALSPDATPEQIKQFNRQIWAAYQANPGALTAPTFTQYLELRGDQAHQLSGAALRNDIGLGMGLRVTRVPGTAVEEAAMGRGAFDFFDGDAAKAVRAVENQITQAGGPGARVAALPVTVISPEHGFIQTTIWRVETANGQEKFVDYNLATGEARTYTDFKDWKQNNELPPGEMTYPRNGHLSAGSDSKPQLEKANTPNTVDTAWEKWIKPTLDGAAIVGGIVLLGAVTLGTGGTAVIAGSALLGGYGVTTGGAELMDRYAHGQTLNLGNPQARNAWLNIVAGGTGMAAMASSLRLANAAARAGSLDDAAQLARMAQKSRHLHVAAQYVDFAALVDTGWTLQANWHRMSLVERTNAMAMIFIWGAGARISVRQSGSLLGRNTSPVKYGGTVELFTDQRGPQVSGAVGVGPNDPGGLARDARHMPEIPSASQSAVVANNPFFPRGTPGLLESMMDYLQEAARITQPGGYIYINGNNRNPYFRNRPTQAELDRLGLKIVHDGALLDQFRGLDFRRSDGSILDIDSIGTIVLIKR